MPATPESLTKEGELAALLLRIKLPALLLLLLALPLGLASALSLPGAHAWTSFGGENVP